MLSLKNVAIIKNPQKTQKQTELNYRRIKRHDKIQCMILDLTMDHKTKQKQNQIKDIIGTKAEIEYGLYIG